MKFDKIIEIVKCCLLLLIAVLLIGIYFNTSQITKPITRSDLIKAKNKKDIVNKIPFSNIYSGNVWVDGGSIDVDNTVEVEINR